MPYEVPLGSTEIHVFPVVAGRAGEHRRLLADLQARRPARVACETEMRHVLGLRRQADGGRAGWDEPFLPRLLRAEVTRRFGGDDVDALFTTYMYARAGKLDFIPLLPDRTSPGFFRRFLARREARGLPDVRDPEVFARKFWHHFLPPGERDAVLGEAARRLAELVYQDNVDALALVAHEVHAERILELTARFAPEAPLEREAPRETGQLAEEERNRYPSYR